MGGIPKEHEQKEAYASRLLLPLHSMMFACLHSACLLQGFTEDGKLVKIAPSCGKEALYFHKRLLDTAQCVCGTCTLQELNTVL